MTLRTGCLCAGHAPLRIGRRDAFGLLAGGAMLATSAAHAQYGSEYEAMLLSCIDPRFVDPVHSYMGGRGLSGKYSQFTIAGAAIAVVAEKFENWRRAFWDNFATSLTLHKITAVIAIDHRDCGAARVAYGPDSISTPAKEDALHTKVMQRFRRELARRHPEVSAETWLMSLDGNVERIG